MRELQREKYDVIIIGAGVIGSALARELSQYRVKVLVLEASNDVACEASGANSGVIHAGYADKPGSSKARFGVEGNRKFEYLSQQLNFP